MCDLSLIHGGLVTCNHVNEAWNDLNFHVNVGYVFGCGLSVGYNPLGTGTEVFFYSCADAGNLTDKI